MPARPDSLNGKLSRLAVGEVLWLDRTSKQPVQSRDRLPPEMRDWLFESAAFMAVPQSSITTPDDCVRLWRVKRIA